jgi:hypothetical protein
VQAITKRMVSGKGEYLVLPKFFQIPNKEIIYFNYFFVSHTKNLLAGRQVWYFFVKKKSTETFISTNIPNVGNRGRMLR